MYRRLVAVDGVQGVVFAHLLAVGIEHLGANFYLIALGGTCYACAHIHSGVVVLYIRCGNVCAPHRHVYLVGYHQMHISEKSGSGIPARRFGIVLQIYLECVFAGFHGFIDAQME